MSLKDLLVHVDSGARAQHRLDLAITLARLVSLRGSASDDRQ